MTKILGYTLEDYRADMDAGGALYDAVYALMAKLKKDGLQDCAEFDHGATALTHWENRQLETMKQITAQIKEFEDMKQRFYPDANKTNPPQ